MTALQLPTLQFEVALFNNPLDTSLTWVDVSASVKEYHTVMGKQHALDRIQAGSLQALLYNDLSEFSPWNTTSPHYSGTPGYGMVARKPIRILETWGGVTKPIFWGLTDSWTPNPLNEVKQDTALVAYDILKLQSLAYLSSTTLYAGVIEALNPLIWYRFDDNVGSGTLADASGNGHTGTAINLTFAQAGAVVYDPDSSADFSQGSGGYGYTPINGPGAGAMSFAIWFKSTDVADTQVILSIPDQVAAGSLYQTDILIAAGGQLQLTYGPQDTSTPGAGQTIAIASSSAVDDGVWHRLVLTVTSAGTWVMYLDGAAVGSAAIGYLWGFGPITIGGLYYYPGIMIPAFGGDLDEFAYFGTTLTSAQVLNDFTIGHLLQNQEFTGQRIAAALKVAGYSSFPQSLATGTVVCAAETASTVQTTLLDYILAAVDTENGLYHQDAAGTLHFFDRNYCQNNSSSITSQGTFGDNAAAPYHYNSIGFQLLADDLDIWPDVQCQRNNGLVQEVTNAASVTTYGFSSLQRTGLLAEFDLDVNDLAQALLLVYGGNAQLRVQAMVLGAEVAQGANIPQMLARILYDRVTVQRAGNDSTMFQQDSVVECISHDFVAELSQRRTTFALSPFELASVPPGYHLLILNDATFGKMDSTNLLGA